MIIRSKLFNKYIKYRNQKTIVDGHKFASKCEAGLYTMLKYMQFGGEIQNLQMEPKVYLTKSKILYKPDFSAECAVTRSPQYYEAKGYPTAVWKIKKRLWKDYGPGILRIYTCKNGTPSLHEEVIPSTSGE